MRWIDRSVLAFFVMLLIAFWFLPAAQRGAVVTWTGVLITTGCALYLSLAYRRLLGTWRGFASLAISSMAALAWLRWQWPLWWSHIALLQNANLVASLLAWVLLIALFASSVTLLVYEDASVAFMGLAWVLIPLVLLAVGVQYGSMERFTDAPLGEQLFWGIPLLWALAMVCLGPLAFLGHYVILLIRELGSH